MSRELYAPFEGDTGIIYRFPIRDGAGYRDFASAACEVYVLDQNGVSYGKRPGVVISPKTSGFVDIFLRGRETDFDGSPVPLWLIPRLYYAQAPNRQPATNLLLNPSFNTSSGSIPDQIATSWNRTGTGGTWAVYANDAAPPSIFDNFQLVNHTTVNDTDYIQQGPAVTLAVGDLVSVGVWHRVAKAAQAKNNNHAIFFRRGGGANNYVQFEVNESDWYFAHGTLICDAADTSAVMGLDGRGAATGNRYDEAFLFKGKWFIRHADAMKLELKRTSRTPKSSNQIAGMGSFEKDSNADGIADGWTKQGSGGTFTIDKDPANVIHGSASQKVVLTDQSAMSLKLTWRGRFKVGDTWRASVKVKTSGTLGSGSGTGGFNVELSTQYFEATPKTNATTNLGVTLATFTDHQVSLAIATADRSELMIIINLNGKTGTMWIDDVRLERTVAGP